MAQPQNLSWNAASLVGTVTGSSCCKCPTGWESLLMGSQEVDIGVLSPGHLLPVPAHMHVMKGPYQNKTWCRGEDMKCQGACHKLSTTTDPEVSGTPASGAVLTPMSSHQARLCFWGSFWAKTASLLHWQGSWKLLELVRYHIVSNTEVSPAALPAQSTRAGALPGGIVSTAGTVSGKGLTAIEIKLSLSLFCWSQSSVSQKELVFSSSKQAPCFSWGGHSSPPQSLAWRRKEISNCSLKESLCLYYLMWSFPAHRVGSEGTWEPHVPSFMLPASPQWSMDANRTIFWDEY